MNLKQTGKLLEERLVMLTTRAEEAESTLREGHSAEAEGDEVLESLEGSAVAEISQINAALARIEDGSYGECVTCGAAVGEKRLEAVPHTPQCITCASKHG